MTEKIPDGAATNSVLWRMQKTPLENNVALRKIFSYSSVRDLKAFRQVCRQWNEEAGPALSNKAPIRLLNSKRFQDFFNYEETRRNNGGPFLCFTRFQLCNLKQHGIHNHLSTFFNGPWRECVTWLKIINLEGEILNLLLKDVCRCFPNLKTLEIVAGVAREKNEKIADTVEAFKKSLIYPNASSSYGIASKLHSLRVKCFNDVNWRIFQELHAPLKAIYVNSGSRSYLERGRWIQEEGIDIVTGKGLTIKASNVEYVLNPQVVTTVINSSYFNTTPSPPHCTLNLMSDSTLKSMEQLIVNGPTDSSHTSSLGGFKYKLKKLKAVIKSSEASPPPLYTSTIYAHKIFSTFTTPTFDQLEKLGLCIQVDARFTRTRSDEGLADPLPLLPLIISQNLSLRHLKLSFMNKSMTTFSSFLSQIFKGIPKYFPNLVSLTVDVLHPLLFESLLSSIKTLERLERLELYFTALPGPEGVKCNYLFGPSIYPKNKDYRGLYDLKGLKTLRLAGSCVVSNERRDDFNGTEGDVFHPNGYHICEALNKMEYLQQLQLSENMIPYVNGSPEINLNWKMMERCKRFTFTELSFCKSCSKVPRRN